MGERIDYYRKQVIEFFRESGRIEKAPEKLRTSAMYACFLEWMAEKYPLTYPANRKQFLAAARDGNVVMARHGGILYALGWRKNETKSSPD